MERRWLAVIILGVGLLFTVYARGAEPIKMGYWNNTPHCYLRGGETKPRGAAITYFEMMAAKMGSPVEWVGPFPLLRLFEYIREGSVDGNVIVVRQPELLEVTYYGNQPYGNSQPILLVRKDCPVQQIRSVTDIEGFRVGWLAGASPSAFMREHLTHFRMDYMTPGDTMVEQSLQKLLLGRIDAIHEFGAFALLYTAKQMGIADQIKVLPLPEPPLPLYAGFAIKSPRGKLLLERYNVVQAETPFTTADYDKLLQQEIDALPATAAK
jgi:polar amino acid transport system substrate-binding protein